jgi:hypothetical protein
MRMWNVEPKLLCRQHLIGEHLEMHYFRGVIIRNRSIKGYIEKGLVEVHNIIKRHNDLANEMTRRNYKHNSELIEFKIWEEGHVNVEQNINELLNRCPKCKERIENERHSNNSATLRR